MRCFGVISRFSLKINDRKGTLPFSAYHIRITDFLCSQFLNLRIRFRTEKAGLVVLMLFRLLFFIGYW